MDGGNEYTGFGPAREIERVADEVEKTPLKVELEVRQPAQRQGLRTDCGHWWKPSQPCCLPRGIATNVEMVRIHRPPHSCRTAETFENPACCRRCAACIRVEPSFDLEIQHATLALRGNCSTRSHVQPGRCRTDRRNVGTGRVYRRARRVPSGRTRFRAQGRDIPHDSRRHLLVRPVSPGSNWRRVSPGCAYRLRHHDVRPRQW